MQMKCGVERAERKDCDCVREKHKKGQTTTKINFANSIFVAVRLIGENGA